MKTVEEITNGIESQIHKVYKSYKTQAKANKIGASKAKWLAMYHNANSPANYIVVKIPSNGRYTPAFDLNEFIRRPDCKKGNIGWLSKKGFYTY